MNAKYRSNRPMTGMAILLLLSILHFGCSKMVQVTPPASGITEATVYNNDATAIAVLTGIYTKMSSNSFATGAGSISLLSGLSADEFYLWSGVSNTTQTLHYTNNLSIASGVGEEFWTALYANIFICNSAIEGVSNSKGLTPAVKQQLLGEAKYLRAFFYFYLVNLYGDLPLALSSDYEKNLGLSRTPKSDVYLQIVTDLKDAEGLLSSNYLDGTLSKTSLDRIRPNKWVATALLARADLFAGNWTGADSASSALINNTSSYGLTNLDNAFKKNSTEAIWQLQPTTLFFNTDDAKLFVIPATGPGASNPVFLSDQLLNSFEPGDQRKTKWVGARMIGATTYYYPYKYKLYSQDTTVKSAANLGEYLMILRLGEQYLIRAEARCQQNNLNGGLTDLNTVRERAGLPDTVTSDKGSLLSAILHERQVELFSEWGHRWLDLKRSGTIDQVMSVATPLKNGSAVWQSYQQMYPIPGTDILDNPRLSQNQGY